MVAQVIMTSRAIQSSASARPQPSLAHASALHQRFDSVGAEGHDVCGFAGLSGVRSKRWGPNIPCNGFTGDSFAHIRVT